MIAQISMKRVCLINESLRGKHSSSLRILTNVECLLPRDEVEKSFINVRAGAHANYPKAIMESMATADALVIAFPLFVYTLSGALTRLLENFAAYVGCIRTTHNHPKVYAIVNCGFVMPQTNEETLSVLKNYCYRLGFVWRFAVSIGRGPLSVIMKEIPLLNRGMRKGFAEMAAASEGKGSATRRQC